MKNTKQNKSKAKLKERQNPSKIQVKAGAQAKVTARTNKTQNVKSKNKGREVHKIHRRGHEKE